MNTPIFTLTTGKTINADRIKFDLLSKDRSKGIYWLIFVDDTELYLSGDEWIELLARQEAWRVAGGYKGTYVDSDWRPNNTPTA